MVLSDQSKLNSAKAVAQVWLAACLVGIAYYAGTKLGFALTPTGRPISTYWPPNAILLAALLLAPRRIWWILLLAVLPAHLFAQLSIGVPLTTVLGWFVGNSAEALLAAICILAVNNRNPLFASIRGFLIFLAFGVFLAPLVTSFVDAGVVVATDWGRDYWVLWTTRLFSNMLASLTLVPTIVLLCTSGLPRLRKITMPRWVEGSLVALTIVTVSVLVFGSETVSPSNSAAWVYAPLPVLLWAAVRCGTGGLSASLVVISLVSIWNAMHGRGPFVSATLESNVMSLQVFLFTTDLPLMFLSAVLLERRTTENKLRETSGKLIDAQEKERHRIARELHDDVGQQLAMVEMELAQLREESDPLGLGRRLSKLSRQVAEISRATRDISHGLHPSHLEYLGLPVALDRLCRDLANETVLKIHFHRENLPDSISPSLSLCLYRVAQEALHNTVKHGRAENASVILRAQAGTLLLHIADDGVGFDSGHEQGLGLASMRERLNAVGGSIRIVSVPDRGTTVEASVPLSGPPLTGISAVA